MGVRKGMCFSVEDPTKSYLRQVRICRSSASPPLARVRNWEAFCDATDDALSRLLWLRARWIIFASLFWVPGLALGNRLRVHVAPLLDERTLTASRMSSVKNTVVVALILLVPTLSTVRFICWRARKEAAGIMEKVEKICVLYSRDGVCYRLVRMQKMQTIRGLGLVPQGSNYIIRVDLDDANVARIDSELAKLALRTVVPRLRDNARATYSSVVDGNDSFDDLPLGIALAIPFIPAGYLCELATVSRACRKAAISSYHKRLKAMNSALKKVPIVSGNESLNDNGARLMDLNLLRPLLVKRSGELPKCYKYRNLWSHLDLNHRIYKYPAVSRTKGRRIIGTRDWSRHDPIGSSEGCHEWQIEWRSVTTMRWQQGILHGIEELGLKIEISHNSLRGDSYLVIVVKTTGSAKELWGLLYDFRVGDKDGEHQFHPIMTQQFFSEPKKSSSIHFGQAHRSGDGTSVAVVDGGGDNEQANVAVFTINASKGFLPRCAVPINKFRFVIPSLSTGGEILSILSEDRAFQGSWAVYDIRNGYWNELLSVRGFGSLSGELSVHDAYFTPDNDFVLVAPPGFHGIVTPSGPGIGRVLRGKEFLPSFARTVIFNLCTQPPDGVRGYGSSMYGFQPDRHLG